MSQKKREGFEGQRMIVIPKKITTELLAVDTLTRQLYITDIGYYPKAKYHYIKRSAGINQHIIIYCIEGRGWIETGKEKVEIQPSQVVVIPANTPHKYQSNEQDPWTIYWIHFRGDLGAFLAEQLLQQAKNYITYSEQRIQLFEDMYANLEKGYSNDNLRYVNMIFYHFLSSLLYADKFINTGNQAVADVLTEVITWMREQIDRVITLQEFADHARLSVSHFSAVFRERTGYSPIEYFNHLKVQKACQYLLFSNMTIKEMAVQLGVNDQYYFSRMFSKLMGMSPSEYRQRNKQG